MRVPREGSSRSSSVFGPGGGPRRCARRRRLRWLSPPAASGGEPASLAPADAPVYFEANLAPEAEGGRRDSTSSPDTVLRDRQRRANSSPKNSNRRCCRRRREKFDYEEEVEPWLGEKAGLYLQEYDGDNFHRRRLRDRNSATPAKPKNSSKSRTPNPTTRPKKPELKANSILGVTPGTGSSPKRIGDRRDRRLPRLRRNQSRLRRHGRKLSEGDEALNESEKFKTAMESAPDEGVGTPLRRHRRRDQAVRSADLGRRPGVLRPARDRTAAKRPRSRTLIPHSDQVEVDVSHQPRHGAVRSAVTPRRLLESLPATAVRGFATPEFGKSSPKA